MPTTKKKKDKPYHLMVILDDDDRRALEDAAEIEKLPKADSIRRAIRAYAKKLRSQKQLAATG